MIAICYSILFVIRGAPWPLSDWLINFEGGFVRRGLPGEVLLQFARMLHVPVTWTVSVLQITCILCLMFSLCGLVGSVFLGHSTLWQKALLLSPATLGFFYFDPALILRKEIALFAIMCLLMVLLQRKRQTPNIGFALFLSLFCPLLLFAHEGLVCYLPYVFALVALGRKSTRDALTVCAVPAALSAIPVLIASHFPGNALTSSLVCRSIGGPNTGLCGGPIFYLGVPRSAYETEVISLLHDGRMMLAFGVTTLLALLPVIAGLVDLWRAPVSPKVRAIPHVCFALSALASVVLFREAQDWTRWIYIHIMCLLLMLFFAVAERRPSGDSDQKTSPILWQRQTVIAVLVLMYATLWHLPEWVIAGSREYMPYGFSSLMQREARHTGTENHLPLPHF